MLLEAGLDYGRGVEYPVSGLTGQLLRVPLLGVSVGISSIAELQFDGGLYNRLAITERNPAPLSPLVTATGDSTSSVEDLVIATKVRVLSEREGRPAFGLRLATKLPNASNESGIGLDTMDFTASLLVGKTVRSMRTVANGGFGILGDPLVGQPAERRHHLRRVAGPRAHAGGRGGGRGQRPLGYPRGRARPAEHDPRRRPPRRPLHRRAAGAATAPSSSG